MPQYRDFYLRPESDPAYQPDQLEVYDELENALQQIRMTLFTSKGEVLGEPNFGTDVDKYLFEFEIDPFSLTRDASSQINTYVSEAKKRKMTVKPARYNDSVTGRDIFVLLIDIPEVKNQISIFYD